MAVIRILLAAFALRVGIRVAFGQDYFWKNGYSDYYALAQNLVAGKGLCFETACAWFPPLYPLFLALTSLGGKHYLLIVIPQAIMGAGTALCAYLIGKELFNPRAGLIACGMAAFYPYYTMHDTALQETGMLTFCTAVSVYLLLRAARSGAGADWFFAGLSLGAVVLIRASLAPFIVLALAWAACFGLQKVSTVFLALCLTVSPWLIRNYQLTGALVLSSQTGRALWIGNNPDTFSHYPGESIDLSTATAWANLTPQERAEEEGLSGNEIQMSDWYARRGLAFMTADPSLTMLRACRKLWAGFSWTLNPARERFVQAIYFVSYVPVAGLGLVGMLLANRRREVVLIGMLFLSFVCVTSIFWAHSSHRSYLDVYWIVFAASVIERSWTFWRGGSVKHLSTEVL